MSILVTPAGFGPADFPAPGRVFPFAAFRDGWDLPEDIPLGVELPVDADPEDLVPWLDRLALIVLPFGTSGDGRGFSLAKRLRRAGYRGRIRARGAVLVDQFRAALRVGIDEVEIDTARAERMPEAHWQAAAAGADYRQRLLLGA